MSRFGTSHRERNVLDDLSISDRVVMEVGATLEEARHLRREHDELIMKLNVSTIIIDGLKKSFMLNCVM